jgi:hypothetical protein
MIWYGIAGTLTLPRQSAGLGPRVARSATPRAQSSAVRRFRVLLIALALATIGILIVCRLVSAARTDAMPSTTQAWSRQLACTLGQIPRHTLAATLELDCAM